MLLSERGGGKPLSKNMLPTVAQDSNSPAHVHTVPVDDGRSYQIQRRWPNGQVFLALITESAKPVEIDCPAKDGAGLALI